MNRLTRIRLISVLALMSAIGYVSGADAPSVSPIMVDAKGAGSIGVLIGKTKYNPKISSAKQSAALKVDQALADSKLSPEGVLSLYYLALKANSEDRVSALCADAKATKQHVDGMIGQGAEKISDISLLGKVDAGKYCLIYNIRDFAGEAPQPGFDALLLTAKGWRFSSDIGLSHVFQVFQSTSGYIAKNHPAASAPDAFASALRIPVALAASPQLSLVKEGADLTLLVLPEKRAKGIIERYAGEDDVVLQLKALRKAYGANKAVEIAGFWNVPDQDQVPDEFMGWEKDPLAETVLLASVGFPQGSVCLLKSKDAFGAICYHAASKKFILAMSDDEKFSQINQMLESTAVWRVIAQFIDGQNP